LDTIVKIAVDAHAGQVDKLGEPYILHPSAVMLDAELTTASERAAEVGPKQSRNMLQRLGLSRFEIPIDSRIAKWLNAFGVPVHLNAWPLPDGDYYNFVSQGFQSLCEACEIFLCVLDASMFPSFDGGKWTADNVAW